MRLGSPRFERAVFRRALAAMDASRDLRGEYGRHRRSPLLLRIVQWTIAVLMSLGLFMGIGRMAPSGTSVALTTLMATGLSLFNVWLLVSCLYGPLNLGVLSTLPVSDRDFARVALRQATTYSAFLGLPFLGFTLGCLRHTQEIGAAAGFAALQWLTALALGVILARYSKSFHYLYAAPLLVVAAFFLAFLKIQPPWLVDFLQRVSLVLPAGWIGRAFEGWRIRGDAQALVVLVPVAGILVFGAGVARRLIRSFRPWEPVWRDPEPPESRLERAVDAQLTAWPDGDAKSGVADGIRSQVREDLMHLMAEPLHDGRFLAGRDWRLDGWVGRVVAAILTLRERRVAEFLRGTAAGWTRRWTIGAGLALGGLVLAFALDLMGHSDLMIAVLILSGTASVMVAGAAWSGGWPGFDVVNRGVPGPPRYAGYPVGYVESAAVMLKIHAVRWLAWLPFGLLSGGLGFSMAGGSAVEGLELAAKIAFLFLAFHPMVIALRFGETMHDGSRFHWRGILMALLVFPCVFLFIVGAIQLFIPEPLMPRFAGAALLVGIAALCMALQAACFRFGRLDQFRTPGINAT